MSGRRRFLFLLLAVVVTGSFAFAWTVADLPPPGLVLRHGWRPSGGATGRTWIVSAGGNHVEFVEMSASYARVRRVNGARRGLIDRLCEIFRVNLGPRDFWSGGWVSADRPYWISRDTLRLAVRRLPTLPDGRLLYLPVWLTAHADGAFRFATVDEVCLAHAHSALAANPDDREAARVDLCRPDAWQWILPGPATERGLLRAQWRDAFLSVETFAPGPPPPRRDERLHHARLIWEPPR